MCLCCNQAEPEEFHAICKIGVSETRSVGRADQGPCDAMWSDIAVDIDSKLLNECGNCTDVRN